MENLIQTLGLKAIENKMVKNLSFGESQRVAVARCLVNSPKVIFADEPTSGLDDSNAKIVIDLILKQAKKTESSLIVSTHDQRIKNFFQTFWKCKNERFNLYILFIKIKMVELHALSFSYCFWGCDGNSYNTI